MNIKKKEGIVLKKKVENAGEQREGEDIIVVKKDIILDRF